MARERDTDLVEVASAAEPPVCRLLDYGKFKYTQTKKERESKKSQKSVGLREVRLRPGIGSHDLDAKSKTIRKLLTSGAKVKVTVVFRGRSITHPELGIGLLRKVSEGLAAEAKLEKAPAMEGRALTVILIPVAAPVARKDSGSKAQEAPPSSDGQEPQDNTTLVESQ